MVRCWKRSGLTIRDFCACEGLSEASFYVWRRELIRRDEKSIPAASCGATNAPAFLPVQVVADVTAGTAADSQECGCLEVQLPTGVRLRVPSGFDRRTLTDVLVALEARPC
jgi:transposase-like protein